MQQVNRLGPGGRCGGWPGAVAHEGQVGGTVRQFHRISLLGIVVPVVGKNQYSSVAGFSHLAAGLACGLSSLAAGLAIGVVGDAGVRAIGQQPALYVPMILILIFGEALGLYGLIVALILSQKAPDTIVC